MRRITFWLLSSLSVVVLLFGYDASRSAPATTASPPAVVSGTNASGSTDSASGTTTVAGDVVGTQWGPVQLQLSVSDGTITEVTVLQQPDGNPRDEEINRVALPVLIQETTQAQSADIDMVSGATVTSAGYISSLQSAIDKAGL